jgi:hypothetical protein
MRNKFIIVISKYTRKKWEMTCFHRVIHSFQATRFAEINKNTKSLTKTKKN